MAHFPCSSWHGLAQACTGPKRKTGTQQAGQSHSQSEGCAAAVIVTGHSPAGSSNGGRASDTWHSPRRDIGVVVNDRLGALPTGATDPERMLTHDPQSGPSAPRPHRNRSALWAWLCVDTETRHSLANICRSCWTPRARMPHHPRAPLPADEEADTVRIGLFGIEAIVFVTNQFTHLLQQARRLGRIGDRHHGEHHARFNGRQQASTHAPSTLKSQRGFSHVYRVA